MTSIVLPMWLIVTMVGAPSLCLVWAVIQMAKIRRQVKSSDSELSPSPLQTTPMMNSAFQNELQALQIDAVFNALSALIETERLKLKNLLCPVLPQVSGLPFVHGHVKQAEVGQPLNHHKSGVRDQIATKIAEGASAGDIASALGISRSEVELAVSIDSDTQGEGGTRLEAVA